MIHLMIANRLDEDGWISEEYTVVPAGQDMLAVRAMTFDDVDLSQMDTMPVHWDGNYLIIGRDRLRIVGRTGDGDYVCEVIDG